jgi:ABC-2 type transport system ATP-binding protein
MDISYAGWGTVNRAIRFVSGFYSDWSSERCDRLLAQFGIDRSARVATLSFGSRVKLALVMALSRDAQLLLLDEPTAGLDPLARQQLFSQLLHFMQNENRTIVISSHQISDLERFADHVVVMQAGQVVAAGAIPDLLDRYVQLDVRLPSRGVPGHVPLSVIARDEDRARVLLDQRSPHQDTLSRLGFEVLGRSSLTLEELFVALMRVGKTAWRPDTSAG